MLAVLKDLAVAVGTYAAQGLVKLIRGKTKDDEWVDVTVSEPPHPGFVDVEHMRAQERASIALSKAAEAAEKRKATTARPPPRKSGTLPKK